MLQNISEIADSIILYCNQLNVLNFQDAIKKLSEIVYIISDNKLSEAMKDRMIIENIKYLRDLCRKNAINVTRRTSWDPKTKQGIPELISGKIVDALLDYNKYGLVFNKTQPSIPEDILTSDFFNRNSVLGNLRIDNMETYNLYQIATGGKLCINSLFRIYLYLQLIINSDVDITILDFISNNRSLFTDQFIPKRLLKDISSISKMKLMYFEKISSTEPTNIFCLCFFNENFKLVTNPFYYFDVNCDMKPFELIVVDEDVLDNNYSRIIREIFNCDLIMKSPMVDILYYSLKFFSNDLSEVNNLKIQLNKEDHYDVRLNPQVDMSEDLRNTMIFLVNTLVSFELGDCTGYAYLAKFLDSISGEGLYEWFLSDDYNLPYLRRTVVLSLLKNILRSLYTKCLIYLQNKLERLDLSEKDIDRIVGNSANIWTRTNRLNKSYTTIDIVAAWVIKLVSTDIGKIYTEEVFMMKSLSLINFFYLSPKNFLILNKYRLGITGIDIKDIEDDICRLIVKNKDNDILANISTIILNRTTRFFNRMELSTNNEKFMERLKKYPSFLPASLGTIKSSVLDNLSLFEDIIFVFYTPDDLIPIFLNIAGAKFLATGIISPYEPKLRPDLSQDNTICIELDRLYKVNIEVNRYVYILEPIGDLTTKIGNEEEYKLRKTSIFEMRNVNG